MRIIQIASIDDSRLEPYRNQRDQWLRARHNPDRQPGTDPLPGRFMAEGALVVEQLLASTLEVESVLASTVSIDKHGPMLKVGLEAGLAKGPGIPIYVCEPGAMDAIAGFHVHRGLLAVGLRPKPADPAQLAQAARLAVVMEDLTNHDNVGGIFRSLAALGGPGSAAFVTARTCDPFYRKALRVSMGHVLSVPHAEIPPLAPSKKATAAGTTPARTPPVSGLDLLEAAGMTPIALTPSERAIDVADLGTIDRPALLVGSEGPGLHPRTLERCRLHVRIPIASSVDSLNVTVAASIALDRLRLKATHAGNKSPRPGV